MKIVAFNRQGVRRVFIPPSASGRSNHEISILYRSLNERFPTLFLAQAPGDLDLGAIPGMGTFYAQRHASLIQKALASASAVIGFRYEPLLFAKAHGVPVVFLTTEKALFEKAEGVGMAALKIDFPAQTANLLKRTEELIRDQKNSEYPAKKQKRNTVGSVSYPICSISNFDYLPYFLGMVENLMEVTEENTTFHLLALDERVKIFLRDHYAHIPIHIYGLEDLWDRNEMNDILGRSIGFQAFSSKPNLILKALKVEKKPVFYCDSDVYFFDSPEFLFKTLESSSFVLFPHWNDEFPQARLDGLFNAGMIGVSPKGEKVLSWWSRMCLHKCSFEHEKGYVGDQGYLDFLPILFDDIKIYRGADHNVARWNVKTLGVRWEHQEKPILANGEPVRTYHAAFADSLGIYEIKFCWDQLVTFFSSLGENSESPSFLKTVLRQQQPHWQTLSRILLFDKTVRKLPWIKFELTSNNLRFFTTKSGKALLAVLSFIPRFSQRLSSLWPKGTSPVPRETFWVAEMKKILFAN